jgi:DNA processing protein
LAAATLIAPRSLPGCVVNESPIPSDLVCAVRLSLVEGVGPRLTRSLLSTFGSPAAVLAAPQQQLGQVAGIGPKVAAAIVAARGDSAAETEIRAAWQHGIAILTSQHDEYPRLLSEIHDPPAVMYRRGQPQADDQLAVAIVGTRHATRYGAAQAERLAGELARAGVTVVSGLARGIDTAAHRGALAAGGRSVAVLAGGLLNIYPAENKPLADQIAERGCLWSEAPPRMVPLRGSFPQRNRIISGMTVGTIVVEAPLKSGALITARHANEQGREVFAVPGPVDNRASRGCHALLRDGATLVETADDVLNELGPLVEEIRRPDGTTLRQPRELQLNDVEQQILQAIAPAPTSIDTITQTVGLPVHQVLSTISVLEMQHLVRRVSGNQVARV